MSPFSDRRRLPYLGELVNRTGAFGGYIEYDDGFD
jgi:hypothetical protein